MSEHHYLSSNELDEIIGLIALLKDTAKLRNVISKFSKFHMVRSFAFMWWDTPNTNRTADWQFTTYPRDIELTKRVPGNNAEGWSKLLPIMAFHHPQEEVFAQASITVPVRGSNQSVGLLSIDIYTESQEWGLIRMEWVSRLMLLANHVQSSLDDLVKSTSDPGLTSREIDCLSMASQGLKAKQIACMLGISEQTVQFYLSRARIRLSAGNTLQAVVRAAQLGLLRSHPTDEFSVEDEYSNHYQIV